MTVRITNESAGQKYRAKVTVLDINVDEQTGEKLVPSGTTHILNVGQSVQLCIHDSRCIRVDELDELSQ